MRRHTSPPPRGIPWGRAGSSVDAATASTDTYEIWDGEIVMRDVKLKRLVPPAARTAPATMTSASPTSNRLQ
jgi:hypothetical protein